MPSQNNSFHSPIVANAADEPEVIANAIQAAGQSHAPSTLSLESMIVLVNAERLRQLERKITSEFIELKKRQDMVTHLHKALKAVNTATVKGELDFSNHDELKQIIAKAKECGAEIDETKFKYTAEERDRLVDNLRMTADDYNVFNDMQLQSITRLTNERYESYQLARSIMKPIHEDKINKSRAIAGK